MGLVMGEVIVFWAFCLGLIFGSFFNVVVYRLPRGLSLVKPGSSCPKCGHRLSSLELIPLVSFLWQRGACRACGERISWRYPLVELLSGLGYAYIAWTSSSLTELLVGLVFFSFLLCRLSH
jgi:prepilin signal peptidase PulO-like enzyme (type II secretory pathway)